MSFLIGFFVSFFAAALGMRMFLGVLRLFGLYATLEECTAKVYVLFGKVIGQLDEPGLRFPVLEIGPGAALVSFFGKVHTLDLRVDQRYLRSQPVNTEEGTPMGIGVWYEMRIMNPVAFLFENMDPAGSLQANVTNATVRCLSNLPLDNMLENRHSMSRLVRAEVSPRSESWGYRLGSVYIRKVHFRDQHMIEQIEQKVVNRLRQVTSAIRQAGANQVDIITSAAEKEAAVEFARAEAVRPRLVGQALGEIGKNKAVLIALMEVLEAERVVQGKWRPDARSRRERLPGSSAPAAIAGCANPYDHPTPRPAHELIVKTGVKALHPSMSVVAGVLGYTRAEPRNTHLSRTTVLVIVPGYDTCEIQQADEKVKSSLRERSEPGALAAP